MPCEKIQDRLLTDHLDGRLSKAEHEKIAAHLKDCATCREFAEIAKTTLLEPFVEAEQLTPPASVWQAVRQRIAAEPRPQASPLRAFLGKLLALPVARKPALVLAGVVSVALLTAILLRQPNPCNLPGVVNLENQIDYVAALVGEDDDDNEGLETDIEQYFL